MKERSLRGNPRFLEPNTRKGAFPFGDALFLFPIQIDKAGKLGGEWGFMKADKKAEAKPVLEVGQLWKVGEFHIEIVQLGKTLCHYRHLRNLSQKGVPVRLEPRPAVEKYLKQNKAK